MKKAFTLIEMMISIILLSIIVTFLYQSVAQLQSSNQQLIKKSDEVDEREDVLKLLYNDFINASSIVLPERLGSSSDTVVMKTSNSFYGMSTPYVRYKVYKEDNTLIRVESPGESLDYEQKLFRFDRVLKEVDRFRVYENKGHYLITLKSQGMEDILLDIIPPAIALSAAVNKDNNSSEDGNTTTPAEAAPDEEH